MNCFDNVVDLELSKSSLKFNEVMNSEEAAAYLRIPVGTLRNWTSNGKIPFRKLGRLNRYLKDDLRNLLDSNKRGGFNGN